MPDEHFIDEWPSEKMQNKAKNIFILWNTALEEYVVEMDDPKSVVQPTLHLFKNIVQMLTQFKQFPENITSMEDSSEKMLAQIRMIGNNALTEAYENVMQTLTKITAKNT